MRSHLLNFQNSRWSKDVYLSCPCHISFPCMIFGVMSVLMLASWVHHHTHSQHLAQSWHTAGTHSVEWMNLLNNYFIGQNPWGFISHWRAWNSYLEHAHAELGKTEARLHPNISMQIVKMLRNKDFLTSLLSLDTELAPMMGSPNSAYLPFSII